MRYNTFVHTIPSESVCATEAQVWLRTWYSGISQPGYAVPSSFEEALSRVCLAGAAIRSLTQGAVAVHLRIVGITADIAMDMAGDISEAIKVEHDVLRQLKDVSLFQSPNPTFQSTQLIENSSHNIFTQKSPSLADQVFTPLPPNLPPLPPHHTLLPHPPHILCPNDCRGLRRQTPGPNSPLDITAFVVMLCLQISLLSSTLDAALAQN